MKVQNLVDQEGLFSSPKATLEKPIVCIGTPVCAINTFPLRVMAVYKLLARPTPTEAVRGIELRLYAESSISTIVLTKPSDASKIFSMLWLA